ncbi:hypothetical protein LTR28_005040 [Elasticomyces elasticus]|nr:hypothetical protein LTR28_005040 [Elasticomyces elasticus]
MPRGADMYAAHTSMYPFPAIFPTNQGIPALLQCLPPSEELYGYLDAFQKRAQSCSFPHVPDEVTRKEVERFLADADKNATAFPDMLALIFATLASGLQMGIYDKSGGRWTEEAMQAESSKGEVYSQHLPSSIYTAKYKRTATDQTDHLVAAAMQALRMTSFMSQPTLLTIQTLVMLGPYLTNTGRFLDAWTLFGITIRAAHSIGLHRNPKYLDPAPALRECAIRQTLWWWMLHMDQQYSMTLGRPLGISGIGDCPPPETLTTNQTILRLGEFVDQFTVLARQILSCDRLVNAKIDEFTDKLLALWDTMPEMLQFNEGWLQEGHQVPEWPLDAMAAIFYCKVHNYLILLNRQRVENSQSASDFSPNSTGPTSLRTSSAMPSTFQSSNSLPELARHTSPLRGRPLVLHSSLSLIHALLFFYHRVQPALICWTMGQQAFNACMILLLDSMETGDLQNLWRVEEAFRVFCELEKHGVHKLASLAVSKISEGLQRLRDLTMKRQESNLVAGVLRSQNQPSLSRRSSYGTTPAVYEQPSAAVAESFGSDTVMGNTGMFLLEDPGLQSCVPQSFIPLRWDMVGSNLSATTVSSSVTTPSISPKAPLLTSLQPRQNVARILPTALTSSFPPTMTTNPYALGLQPRMPSARQTPGRRLSLGMGAAAAAYPLSSRGHAGIPFVPGRGPRQSNLDRGPRGVSGRRRVAYVHGR